ALDAGGEDAKVRTTFVAFQKALKAQDTAAIWKLLDSESQEAATRTAKALQAAYAKASDNKKAQLEKAMGLTDAQLAKLTGHAHPRRVPENQALAGQVG